VAKKHAEDVHPIVETKNNFVRDMRVNILPDTEKQGELAQLGGWQDMARRRYQKGSIRKRGKRHPVWELQWWEDFVRPDGTIGRRRESVILGYTSEITVKQARKEAEKKLSPVNAGKAVPYSTLTLQEFVDQFFLPLAFPILKSSTRKRYRSTLDLHLLPALGKCRLCDIRTVEVQRFVLQKFDGGLGWETCNHLRNLLSKIFANAKKWGHFAGTNPALGVELPERRQVREKRVLMPEQVARLLAVLREPIRTMIFLAILTGLRVGEILALRWQDVDLDQGELRVVQAVYRGCMGSPKTKGSRRTIPLPQAVSRALKDLAQRAHGVTPEGLVFPSRKGTVLNDTNLLLRVLKPAGRLAGVAWVSWHTFRRTHATLLQLAGGSAKDAQAQLGHSQITTTLGIYTIPVPAHQREAVEKLSQMVTNGDELGGIRKLGIAQPTLLQ
jgi:integrase